VTAIITAIAGAPGSGKSSVCRALAQEFDGRIVSVDANAAYTTMSPSELSAWIDAGVDVNVFDLTEITEELALEQASSGHVFFETHFGRVHQETGQYIDHQVYLKLPLELALARQLEKVCSEFIESGIADMGQLRWFKGFLASYQDFVAPLLAIQAERLAAGADLVVDASRPLPVVIAEIIDYLHALD
jgi:uridine kinase